MLKNKLNGVFFKKNATDDCFTEKLDIFVKLLKKVILIMFFIPYIVIPPNELTAESQGSEIQDYVRSGAAAQERKRKAYENSQKESGLIIKRYLKNNLLYKAEKVSPLLQQKKWLNRVWLH